MLSRGPRSCQAAALARAVAAAGLAVVGRDFAALEVLAQDEVDHAADGVGAVHRRGADLQHFDVVDHVGRDRVDVVVLDAVAVDQDQRALLAQAAQGDGRGAVAAAVVDLRVGRGAGDAGQRLQQVAQGLLAALLDLLAIDHGHRAGGIASEDLV
ncbi:hypothetical protein NB693_20440 [Pantoea ananatis]|nr:hypothetical protein [Pantoea ananatis]